MIAIITRYCFKSLGLFVIDYTFITMALSQLWFHNTVCPHYNAVFGIHDIEPRCKRVVTTKGNYPSMSLLGHEYSRSDTINFAGRHLESPFVLVLYM